MLDREVKGYFDLLHEYKLEAAREFVRPWAQLVDNLRGRVRNPAKLVGTYLDEEELLHDFDPSDKRNAGKRQLVLATHYARITLLYILGDHEGAELDRVKHETIEPEGSTFILKFFHAAMATLNCLALAGQTPSRWYRRQMIGKSRRYIKLVREYGKGGSPNTPPLLALFQAERLSISGRHGKAALLYADAIHGFQKGQFHLFEAIANERLARCLSTTPRTIDDRTKTKEASLYTALAKFEAFGATVKVEQLRRELGN